MADAYGLTMLTYWGFGAVYRIPEFSFVADAIAVLVQDPLVRYAEPDGYICLGPLRRHAVEIGPEPPLADKADEQSASS